MKKWILLFLALVLLISIASIGIGCKGKEAPKPATEEQVQPAEAPKPAVEEQAKPAGGPPPPGLNFGESTAAETVAPKSPAEAPKQ